MRPLVEALRAYALAAGKIHSDDTLMPVLALGNGQTKTGRLWVYMRDDRRSGSTAAPAAWFAYTPSFAVARHFRRLPIARRRAVPWNGRG